MGEVGKERRRKVEEIEGEGNRKRHLKEKRRRKKEEK